MLKDRGNDNPYAHDSIRPDKVSTNKEIDIQTRAARPSQLAVPFWYSVIDSLVLVATLSFAWLVTSHEYFGISRIWEEKVVIVMTPCAIAVVFLMYFARWRSFAGSVWCVFCLMSFVAMMAYNFMQYNSI